jgi:hypothetical protein
MWNAPSKKTLSTIPRLYSTEHIPLHEKQIYLHFFIGGCDWYVCEIDETHEFMWGFAILNNDYQCAEWGYVSLSELKSIRMGFVEIDFDLHWTVRPAIEVATIRKCHPHWCQHETLKAA